MIALDSNNQILQIDLEQSEVVAEGNCYGKAKKHLFTACLTNLFLPL